MNFVKKKKEKRVYLLERELSYTGSLSKFLQELWLDVAKPQAQKSVCAFYLNDRDTSSGAITYSFSK